MPQGYSSDQAKDLHDLYASDTDAHRTFRDGLDRREAMMVGEQYSAMQNSGYIQSGVKTNGLSTMLWESTGRVVAQLPSGSVRYAGVADMGGAKLSQLLLDRYIVPNAGEQYDLLTTFRLLNQYSKLYGVQPMMYSYKVSDIYVGSTLRLPPLRAFTPQAGVHSMRELQYAFMDSFVTVGFLEQQLKNGTWKPGALKAILRKAEEAGHDRSRDDQTTSTYLERNRDLLKNAGGKGENAIVHLVTKYEAGKDGHWITFCPDFACEVVRDIPNPHKNAKIPIILKHCFPTLDSIWGIGDMERGESLELAINTLFNLFLDGIKLSIYPPKMVVTGHAVMDSLKSEPGATWLMNQVNAVQPYQTGAGEAVGSFQVAWEVLRASMLNLMGTTDTATQASTDPAFGKTPQALKQLAGREATRDNWDRFMLESSIEEAYDEMLNLLFIKQEQPIKIDLFKEEVAELRKAYPDDRKLMELGMHDSGNFGSMDVTRDHLRPMKGKDASERPYRFYIDSSSTAKQDQAMEHEAISEMLLTLVKAGGPQMFPNVDFAELVKRWAMSAGIQDAEKLIKDPAKMATQEQQQTGPDGLPIIPGVNTPGAEVGKPPPLARPEFNTHDPEAAAAMQNMMETTTQ